MAPASLFKLHDILAPPAPLKCRKQSETHLMAFTMSFTAVALALISWPCTFVTLSPGLKPALSATDP